VRAIFFHEGTRWAGSARAFTVAVRGLAARGWDASLACPAGGPVHEQAAASGVDVIPLSAKPSLFGDAERLHRAVKDRRADVVFVHSEHEQLAAATAVWRAKHGVVVRRVCAGAQFTFGRSARAAMRIAPTAVLFTRDEDAAKLPAEAGALASVVADVGVEEPAEPATAAEGAPQGAPADSGGWRAERRLVCVCEPGARARTAIVLRAVAMLAPRHRELRLHLVGPGASDEELRLHAAALGIHRLVRHVTDREADRTSRARAHVGWVTAEGDDGAFGALDFMAAGVPVLAERGGVGARYVADAITGVHLVPGDVPGTAASLAELLAREEQRTAMGNAGRARLKRAFGEAAMIDGFARAATAGVERAPTRARAAR
jgi:glycosyltransferase involved in cell wall biosynthesis